MPDTSASKTSCTNPKEGMSKSKSMKCPPGVPCVCVAERMKFCSVYRPPYLLFRRRNIWKDSNETHIYWKLNHVQYLENSRATQSTAFKINGKLLLYVWVYWMDGNVLLLILTSFLKPWPTIPTSTLTKSTLCSWLSLTIKALANCLKCSPHPFCEDLA